MPSMQYFTTRASLTLRIGAKNKARLIRCAQHHTAVGSPIMRHSPPLVCLVLALVCISCARASYFAPKRLPESFVVDVFSARGFLGGSEYERYRLLDQALWRECGYILRRRAPFTAPSFEGDEIFAVDPNLSVRERRVDEPDQAKRQSLERLASSILHFGSTADSTPPPGSVFSLSDVGVVEILLLESEPPCSRWCMISLLNLEAWGRCSAVRRRFTAFPG